MIKNKKNLYILFLIFLLGIWLRYKNNEGFNIIFDYDQYEDQFYTYSLAVDHKLPIIGRAVYGDPDLHHGVFYYYYNLIPFLVSRGNPLISAYWNIFFNSLSILIIFLLAKMMFGESTSAFLAAAISAVAFDFIKFSNWLTIDTVSIFLISLFFLGLWSYYQRRIWGMFLSSISLGLLIQSDISFIYLFSTLVIYWLIFRPRIYSIKLTLLAILLFIGTIFTLILTEIKLNFAGLKTLLSISHNFDTAKVSYFERLNLFSEDFLKFFAKNLFPSNIKTGLSLSIIILVFLLYKSFSRKASQIEKRKSIFLLLFLFAPSLTLIIGYHQKPWFWIWLPPAIALSAGFFISELKKFYLIVPLICFIILSNTLVILQRSNQAYKLFDDIYDSTSYLKFQLEVLNYTYQQSHGQSFSINAVTYPLYYNGMWAYLYNWYGQGKYGYLPSWEGGDQLHPYDLLPKSNLQDKVSYMIISRTSRIPEIYQNQGQIWAIKQGKLTDEKQLDGFTVLKIEKTNETSNK